MESPLKIKVKQGLLVICIHLFGNSGQEFRILKFNSRGVQY